ncbi:MAG: hypothetical protein HZC40_14715 [Chloroflexi bacterium]|nr:hypothetical protein [Chloroflexota bacterium]
MQTVFIRHNLDSKREILEHLWTERLIAVHFDPIPSTNPEDYGSAGKVALKRMLKYCEAGAVVGAAFRSIRPSKMIVGEIEPGSKVEVLERAKDPGYKDFIYKVVRLKNAREISYADYPLLVAIQPRQGTITGWPSAEKYLLAVLGKHRVSWSVDSLHPSQLEVLCYEYLKMRGILKALILPIGRTLMDVDICGLGADGQSVFAQITHSADHEEIKRKREQLKEFHSQEAELIFFGPASCKEDNQVDQYIPIEEVFEVLSHSGVDSVYRQMISRMLKW